MEKREIAVLSSRMLSIYALISAFRELNLPILIDLLFNANFSGPLVVLVVITPFIPFALLLALGFFLWRNAGRIAGLMVGGGEPQSPGPGPGGRDLQAIAFLVLGMFLLASSLPWLLQMAVRVILVYQENNIYRAEIMTTRFVSELAGLVLQAAAGLWLFLGSRGITGMLYSIRNAGLVERERQ